MSPPTTLHRLASHRLGTSFTRPNPPFRSFTSSHTFASRLRQPGEPTGPNEPPSHITAPPSKSPLKVWPILAIFALGSFLFKKIVDQRKEQGYTQAQGQVVGYSSVNQAPSGRSVKPSHPH